MISTALEEHGHRAIAVRLPADDESAGLAAYADVTADGHLVALANPGLVAERLIAG